MCAVSLAKSAPSVAASAAVGCSWETTVEIGVGDAQIAFVENS